MAAATSVGEIGLDLKVNSNEFKSQMNGLMSLAKTAGKALAGAFAVKKIVDFGKACIDLGSDLAEVQNVVDVAFKDMSGQIDTFAQNAATQFGLSETMAKRYAGTFGSMANAFGITGQAAVDMSTSLTGLAGDVASFYNLTQDEAYTKLKSVFTGETESLKDLGVVMTQTALDSFALANGFGKTTKAMTEGEKVQLRYMFVQNQLKNASGDFARTSGGWANQIRILNLQIESLKASIGQGLINLFTPIIKVVNTLIGKLVTLANAFKAFTELITGKKSQASTGAITETAGALTDATVAADGLSDATGSVGNAAKKAVKEMRALMGFDAINKLSEQISDTGSGSSGSGGSGGGALDLGGLTSGADKLEEGSSKVSDFADKVKKYLEPAAAAFDRFKASLSAIGKTIGSGLKWILDNILVPLGKWTITEVIPRFFDTLAIVLNILNNVLIAMQPYWNWFWTNVLQPIAAWTGGIFLSVWDRLNGLLQKFSDWCAENPEIIGGVASALIAFFAAMTLVNGITALVNGVVGTFSTVIGALSNPVTLAVIAIAALVAAGIWLWKNWDDISAKLSEIWESIKTWCSEKFNAMRDEIAITWERISTKAETLWTYITTYLAAKWDAIKRGAVKKFEAIKTAISEKWEEIKTGANEIWTNLTTDIENWWEGLKTSAKEKFNGVKKNIADKWDDIKTKAAKTWSTVKTALTDNWEGIKTTATDKFDSIATALSDTWEKVKTGAGKAWGTISSAIKSTLKSIWDGAVEAGTGIKDALVGAFTGILEFLRGPINLLIACVNWLLDGVDWALGQIESKLTFRIPNPIGDGYLLDWSASLPRIGYRLNYLPEFAQGAYLAANTPQLAIVGDNKHEGEFVAPESKLLEMAKMAAAGGGISKTDLDRAVLRIISALSQMGFYIDSEQIAAATQRGARTQRYRYNRAELT